jgi:hypothetical protein
VQSGWLERNYDRRFRRYYASIMPQAVSAWCRQLGHEVHYATYWGQGPAEELLPRELDVVFVATYTQASTLAYALARLYRRRGVRTVLGGPHATAFPTDSLRFFDLVVHDCDKSLIAAILDGEHPPGSVVSISNVPLLTSVGCPYRCDFCVDWKNDYVMLPRERLREDLRYVAEQLPGIILAFHDPNFAVRFDEVLDLLEEIPAGRRNPYLMESSLSILRGPRLHRLRDTNCIYAAPGVESWTEYSNKAGVGKSVGHAKVDKLVEHFTELDRYVPGLQANFIFGTDGDQGEEPAALTREFIRRLPFVWPTVNIPVPFGGTPLYDRFMAEDRVLRAMPFAFYYAPFTVVRPRHYGIVEFYDLLIGMYEAMASPALLVRRVRSARSSGMKALHVLRVSGAWVEVRRLRRLRDRIAGDPELLAFHEGRTRALPSFYQEQLRWRLGRYAELLAADELAPELEPLGGLVALGGGRALPRPA